MLELNWFFFLKLWLLDFQPIHLIYIIRFTFFFCSFVSTPKIVHVICQWRIKHPCMCVYFFEITPYIYSSMLPRSYSLTFLPHFQSVAFTLSLSHPCKPMRVPTNSNKQKRTFQIRSAKQSVRFMLLFFFFSGWKTVEYLQCIVV